MDPKGHKQTIRRFADFFLIRVLYLDSPVGAYLLSIRALARDGRSQRATPANPAAQSGALSSSSGALLTTCVHNKWHARARARTRARTRAAEQHQQRKRKQRKTHREFKSPVWNLHFDRSLASHSLLRPATHSAPPCRTCPGRQTTGATRARGRAAPQRRAACRDHLPPAPLQQERQGGGKQARPGKMRTGRPRAGTRARAGARESRETCVCHGRGPPAAVMKAPRAASR